MVAIERILAPNPGPMTLDGTNTYVLGGRVVVDPGPADPEHLERLVALRPHLVLVTHHHPDHVGAATACAARYGVPVLAHPDTARLLAGRGANLVLVARNEPALKALAEELKVKGAKVEVVAADVADETALRQAAAVASRRANARLSLKICGASLSSVATW